MLQGNEIKWFSKRLREYIKTYFAVPFHTTKKRNCQVGDRINGNPSAGFDTVSKLTLFHVNFMMVTSDQQV
jgi:hypothetical protein